MKNKGIILSVIGIIIVSTFITIIINKNTKEYINYNGAMLALTINGEKADSFPSDSSKYHVDIDCTGGKGKYQPVKVLDSNGLETDEYKMKFTVEDITGDTVCNIDFISITDEDLLINEVEAKATSGVDGYRYQGKEPNNWVWFNNEMWRIIGSIPTCTDATILGTSGTCNQTEDTKPRLVKIIRANSIGSIGYNTENSNSTWGSGNTLYTLLNEYYYGKGNATGNSLCLGYETSSYTICNYERIGISNNSTDYYGKMIKSVYMNVGTVSNTSTKIDAAYDLEFAAVSKLTKIGLMSASDYGYATSEITYRNVALTSLGSYTKTNWLYNGYGWTMSSYNNKQVFYIFRDGNLSYSSLPYGNNIWPTVYLDPSIYIISGTGTELDPYIIGL